MLDEVRINGAKIRALRENRGWSQRDLWRESGVDQSLISALETDRKEDLRFSTIVALARALGVSAEEMLAPTEAVHVEPTDPQINVMMRLVNDMTAEERASAVTFMNFVMKQRRQRVANTQKRSRSAAVKAVTKS